MSKEFPLRHIRIPDEIWESMRSEAKEMNVTTSTMIGLVWLAYLERKGIKLQIKDESVTP